MKCKKISEILANLLGFYWFFGYFRGARGGRNFWPIDDFWPMMSYAWSCEIICIYDTHIWKYDQNLKNDIKFDGVFIDEILPIWKAASKYMMCQMCVHTSDVPFGV